ncbi:phosphoesterase, MJ0936 family [Nannocystis exedens]|uniref:Phosphoesterase n=1 Tax=Nannocystis exedens TaxID=54 RepID=A0A1I1WHV0_9BACT|nr:YfcE family phosphodiesterase [Nannocystis exedens]PCC67736.1 Phosphodiesterase YfcE [Nannocystis exedens]SFD94717.1 phosphoesterase, MJ0936 family [Nannocystis exedens]
MRLGLISDIHADHRALLRALDILAERGADKVVCLGDMVEKGLDGDRVVDTLREHAIVCVRGNHDDNAVRRHHEGDRAANEPLLGADAVAFLESLAGERDYCWEGVRVVLSHIAPGGVDEPVLPELLPKRLKRVLRGYEADLVLLGHTHRPMKARHGDVWFVNPGSVAGSRLRDSHTCAIVELPAIAVEVFSLHDGRPVALPSAEPAP